MTASENFTDSLVYFNGLVWSMVHIGSETSFIKVSMSSIYMTVLSVAAHTGLRMLKTPKFVINSLFCASLLYGSYKLYTGV